MSTSSANSDAYPVAPKTVLDSEERVIGLDFTPSSLKIRLKSLLRQVGLGTVWNMARSAKLRVRAMLLRRYLRKCGVTLRGGLPDSCDGIFPKIEIEEGGYFEIGDKCRFRPGGYIHVCKGARLVMGYHVGVNALNVRVSPGNSIIMEDYALVGWGVTFMDTNHHGIYPDNLIRPKPIVLKRDCWVGSYAFIFGGVTIGESSVVGAASVIRRDIPPETLAYGNGEIVTVDLSPKYDKWEKSTGSREWHRH